MACYDREERRRKVIAGVMIAGLVLLIVFGWQRNCRKGIVLGDMVLYRQSKSLYSSDNAQITVNKEEDSYFCELTTGSESRSAEIVETEDVSVGGAFQRGNPVYQVTFDDGTVVTGYRSTYGDFYNPDWPLESHMSVTVGDQIDLSDEMTAQLMMKAAFGDTESNGSGWLVFFGALIYVMGMLGWLFPEQMHEFTNLGKRVMYQDADLTDAGVMLMKMSSIVIMALGIFLALRLFPGI